MYKKVIFILLFFICNNTIADIEYKILATVNNKPITSLDLKNELEIIKILNKTNLNKIKTNTIALNNLIEENIKINEIKKNNITIDSTQVINLYNTLVKNLNINQEKINKKNIFLLKKKIEIDISWNDLIRKKYSWKISINMNEINKKITDKQETNSNFIYEKDKLIALEKNKKLQVYSNYHLNLLKKQSFIKYF